MNFNEKWNSSRRENDSYTRSLRFEEAYLELIQDHQDLNFSYDVIWDALKQDFSDHCEPYKFDTVFENEILKSIDIDCEEFGDIWDFVLVTKSFDTYKEDKRFELEYLDVEYDLAFDSYSHRSKRPLYMISGVFEEVFHQLVPEHGVLEEVNKEVGAKKKRQKQQTSLKLKTLLELRTKRLKLMDENIITKKKEKGGVLYECRQCGFASERKRKLYISHILPSHILKPRNKSGKSKKRRKNKCKVSVKSTIKRLHTCSDLNCNKKFTSRYARKRHYISVHVKTFGFKNCELCWKRFRDNYNLSRHMEINHQHITCFKCILCSYRSARRYNLIRHAELNHAKNVLDGDFGFIRCDICRKLFSSLQTLKKHSIIHQAISIGYNCPVCSLVMSENHLCNLNCSVCGRTFRSRILLKKHMKIHAKVKNIHQDASNIDHHEKLARQLQCLDFN